MNLILDELLEQSAVVANCRMNRERSLTGGNGYTRELGFNPFHYVRERVLERGMATWLDLCCGSGIALVEAARLAIGGGIADRIRMVGVDLVGMFAASPPDCACLQFVEASLHTWDPRCHFDLITCVHGLHYIGDKLDLIARAASWLTPDGIFVATLDLRNIRIDGHTAANRVVTTEFRRNGLIYDSRRKRLTCSGCKTVDYRLRYIGANADARPNFSGQAAVDAYYLHCQMLSALASNPIPE